MTSQAVTLGLWVLCVLVVTYEHRCTPEALAQAWVRVMWRHLPLARCWRLDSSLRSWVLTLSPRLWPVMGNWAIAGMLAKMRGQVGPDPRQTP